MTEGRRLYSLIFYSLMELRALYLTLLTEKKILFFLSLYIFSQNQNLWILFTLKLTHRFLGPFLSFHTLGIFTVVVA